MPSPFPGMNPYLEAPGVWRGFHQRLVTALADAIARQVRPRYYVHIEEHVYLQESPDEWELVGLPDASVTRSNGHHAPAGGGGVAAAPQTIFLPTPGKVRQPFLEIQDRADRQVVTVIEVLSPSNKAGDDRGAYVTKRHQVLRSTASLVEIDLLRGGERPQPNLPDCDYYALVSRPADRPRAGLWPLGVRDRLPELPIPLRPGEAEPTVDLQALVHQIYDNGAYDLIIYATPPDPPLAAADAAWAAGLVPPPPAR